MATAAAIVDKPLPNDAAEDSFNLLPALTQQADKPIRPYLLMQGFRNKRSLVIREGNWKLLAHEGSGGNNYDKNTKLTPFKFVDKRTITLIDVHKIGRGKIIRNVDVGPTVSV